MSKTFQLIRPIVIKGKEVQEITLRPPIYGDVMDLGLPTLLIVQDGGGTAVEIRQNILSRYVARLAGIPLESLRGMSLQEMSLIQAYILGFFGTNNEGQVLPDAASISDTNKGDHHG